LGYGQMGREIDEELNSRPTVQLMEKLTQACDVDVKRRHEAKLASEDFDRYIELESKFEVCLLAVMILFVENMIQRAQTSHLYTEKTQFSEQNIRQGILKEGGKVRTISRISVTWRLCLSVNIQVLHCDVTM